MRFKERTTVTPQMVEDHFNAQRLRDLRNRNCRVCHVGLYAHTELDMLTCLADACDIAERWGHTSSLSDRDAVKRQP